MGQMQKISKNNTKVKTGPEGTTVKLHSTIVVEFDEFRIVLNSGGWQTVTTKARMNQTSNEFDLGFTVFQKNHEWFVRFQGTEVPFEDGMALSRDNGVVWSTPSAKRESSLAAIRRAEAQGAPKKVLDKLRANLVLALCD